MDSNREMLNTRSSATLFSTSATVEYLTTESDYGGAKSAHTTAGAAAYDMSDLDEENDKIARSLMPAMLYLAVLIVVGVVGNLLVLYVFTFRLRSSTQHFFIVCLAVFDLVCCTVSMPAEIVDITLFYKFESGVACKILRLIIAFSTLASSLTLVAIAIDRFRKVCKPTEAQVSLHVAKLSLVPILAGALLFSWPTPVLYGISTVDSGIPGFPGKDCTFSDEFKDTKLPAIYNSALFFGFGVQVLVMVLLYSLILRDLKRHSRFLERWKKNEIPISGTDTKNSRKGQGLWMTGSKGGTTNFKVEKDNEAAIKTIGSDINFCQHMITVERRDAIDRSEKATSKTETRTEDVLSSFPNIDPDAALDVSNDHLTAGTFNNNNGGLPCSLSTHLEDSGGFSRASCPNAGAGALCEDCSQRSSSEISRFGSCNMAALQVASTTPDAEASVLRLFTDDSVLQTAAPLTLGTTRDLQKSTRNPTLELDDEKTRGSEKVSKPTSANTSPRNIASKTTLIAFWITLVFILSYLPHLSLQVAKLVHTIDDGKGSLLVFNNIIVRSFFINSVANPFIYGVLNVKFRIEVKIILKRLACRD